MGESAHILRETPAETNRVDLDRLTQLFPPHARKQRTGAGGKQLDYIPTHTIIHRLNDATGNRWDFRLTHFDLRGDIYVAVGELTIPGLGTRTGVGVQRVSDKGGEDLVKGAASDCLKKCATLFGVGIELYGPDYEAGEIEERKPTPIDQHRQSASAPVGGTETVMMREGGEEKHWLQKVASCRVAEQLDRINADLIARFGQQGVRESVWTALAARNRAIRGEKPA